MPIIPDYEAYRGGEHRPSVPSPRSAGLVAEANAKLGGSLGEVALELQDDLRRRLSDAGDEGARNEGELIAHRALKRYADFRQTNPDGKAWEPELKLQAEAAGREIDALPASEPVKLEVRRKAEAGFQKAAQDGQAELLVLVAKRARQSLGENVARLQEEGDFPGAIERIRSAVERQVISAAEGRADEASVRGAEQVHLKKRRMDELDLEMGQDPEGMLARLRAVDGKGNLLHELDLEPAMRSSLLRKGEETLVKRREEEFRSLKMGIERGFVSEKEIDELPQHLGPQAKEALRAHARRIDPPDAAEATGAWRLLGEVGTAFMKWQEGSLGTGGYMQAFARAQEKVMAVVPPGWSGRLRSTLESFDPERLAGALAQGSATVAEQHRKLIEIQVRNLANEARDRDLLGDMWVPEDRERAEAWAEEAVGEVTRWLESEKAPDQKAAIGRIQEELLRRQRMATVRKVADAMPGSVRAFIPPLRAEDGTGMEEEAAGLAEELENKIDGHSNN